MVDPGRVLCVHHVAVQRVEHLGTPGRDSQAGQPAASWASQVISHVSAAADLPLD